MPEQNWSNQTPEQLAKLSDQRLGEILKRARKAKKQNLSKYRTAVFDAAQATNVDESKLDTLPMTLNEIGQDPELAKSMRYFEVVKAECDKRPDFGNK